MFTSMFEIEEEESFSVFWKTRVDELYLSLGRHLVVVEEIL
jgi:hypothetical protein